MASKDQIADDQELFPVFPASVSQRFLANTVSHLAIERHTTGHAWCVSVIETRRVLIVPCFRLRPGDQFYTDSVRERAHASHKSVQFY